MTDGFFCLIHGSVFGRDDENDYIRDVGPSSAHRRKRRVTRSVEKSDAGTGGRQNEGERADVLSDATKLLTDEWVRM